MQLIYNVMLVSTVLQSVSVVHISTLFQILFPYRSLLCLVTQSCPTLVQVMCDSMDCSPPGSSVHWDSPGKNTGVYCHALLQGNLPNPGSEPRSPTLQVDSLSSELPGKPHVGHYRILRSVPCAMQQVLISYLFYV